MTEEDDLIPNPDPNAEANGKEQVGRRLLAALERLAKMAWVVEQKDMAQEQNSGNPIHSMERTQRNSKAFSSSAH
jgi:hypothetical protein